MEGVMYGYARVSSREQNLRRQMDALSAFGVGKRYVFADKASGKDFNRPAYKQLMATIQCGDIMVISSIDRLGRNYEEILNEWHHITHERGIAIVVLDMPLLDTRNDHNGLTGTFIADMVLQILSYVAQIERENIKVRQSEGIASAQARGVRFGRPKVKRPVAYMTAKKQFIQGKISRKAASEELKISMSTFTRWLREDGVYRFGPRTKVL